MSIRSIRDKFAILAGGLFGRQPGSGARPLRWPERHAFEIVIVVVALVAAGIGGLGPWSSWSPWYPCGAGLSPAESGCVGLDEGSSGFRDGDPLADLEEHIAQDNAKIKGEYATIVVLDDMTPEKSNDTVGLRNLRHRIEGAITAAWRVNHDSGAAGGTSPKIKLKLASYGLNAGRWTDAVDAIEQAAVKEHIVAVTGVGQSRDETRRAVKHLSDHHLVTVATVTSADNMNRDPDTGRLIPKFFRVTPTNAEMARAAVSYIADQKYKKPMLVQDTNLTDAYALTLAKDVTDAFAAQHPALHPYGEPYRSPNGKLSGISRSAYMQNQFAKMRPDICSYKPDLIYLSGRGTDIGDFLRSLAGYGSCGLGKIDLLTSDDAVTLLGSRLPPFNGLKVRVLYTGVAVGDEWAEYPKNSDRATDYGKFATAFAENGGFPRDDLQDGHAMMYHDAVLAAATAVRDDTAAIGNPATVADPFLRYTCRNSIPGASGELAFDRFGNAVDKPMPIIEIRPDGSAHKQALTWATGKPFDSTTC